MKRQHFSSGTNWEQTVGYARAVRKGPYIHISGTTSFDEKGEIIGVDDPYRQTVQIINNIDRALRQAGGALEDVIRTRIYVTDIDHWQQIGRAHHLFFREIRPATTLVQVSRLIAPEMLVEIEAEAIVTEE